MRLRTIICTGAVILGIAGCGEATSGPAPTAAAAAPTADTSTPQTAAPPAAPTDIPAVPSACTARSLAAAGNWDAAETHYLSAETAASTSNPGEVNDFYQLLSDAEAVASDKLSGSPTAADIATYTTDQQLYAADFAAC